MIGNSILYATLRIKRAPISDRVVCFKLRVSNSLPVHSHPLHEEDITDLANMATVQQALDELRRRFRCARVELDVHRNVLKKLEANA